jgi:tryptophan 7-halogenase
MKIAIIGKGTSSIITALTCIKNNHDVDIYFDPNQPHVSVGESTTPHVANLIDDVLGLNIFDLMNENIISVKYGIKFINWGVGKSFKHGFQHNNFAFHFETQKFNPFINNILEENNYIKYIPQKVKNYKIDNDKVYIEEECYDFIIFCSGWCDESEYIKPYFETVNSAVLFAEENIDEYGFTLHKATEDGWQFGLPFPDKNITKCGYLFDRNKISTNKVKEKLKHLKIKNNYEWTPKFSKKIIQNQHVAYNGNKLFFLEPLQALSIYYFIQSADLICEYLNDRNVEKLCKTNQKYHYEMWTYQLSLAYHYQYGSIYDSNFWNNTTKKAKEFMSYTINGNEDLLLSHMVNDLVLKNNTNFSKIGIFECNDIRQLHCGMTQTKINDIVKKYLTI